MGVWVRDAGGRVLSHSYEMLVMKRVDGLARHESLSARVSTTRRACLVV